MYNALGQRVRDYQGSATDTLTLTYPRDIFGQRTGTWAEWPSQSWIGWNVYWSQIAGQRLNMGGASSYLDHSDAVDSTTMETDQTGAVVWDTENYPWGQDWTRAGQPYVMHFAGMQGFENPGLVYPTDFRKYNPALGRWMTPDPLGGDVSNPQSLNRYGYVTNNPTTLTDPSGLGPCDPFDPLDCGPPTCDAFDFEGCQNGCNPAWANNCVLYCYELGTCNGRNGGGGGGSSGGGGGGTVSSAPPAGQPPLAGGIFCGPFGCVGPPFQNLYQVGESIPVWLKLLQVAWGECQDDPVICAKVLVPLIKAGVYVGHKVALGTKAAANSPAVRSIQCGYAPALCSDGGIQNGRPWWSPTGTGPVPTPPQPTPVPIPAEPTVVLSPTGPPNPGSIVPVH